MSESTITVLPTQTTEVSNEAAFAALLSQLYLRNPDLELLRALEALDPQALDDDSALAAPCKRLLAAACAAQHDEQGVLNLKRDWTKLFRGISPEYGPTAPYAFLFLKGKTLEMMGDLAALYLDGGYDGYQDIGDRIDYIGTCLRYWSVLDLQIEHSIETKDSTEYARLRLCRQVFLQQYLNSWLGVFTQRARAFVQTDFYAALLDLTDAVLEVFAHDCPSTQEVMSEQESRDLAHKEDRALAQKVAEYERSHAGRA